MRDNYINNMWIQYISRIQKPFHLERCKQKLLISIETPKTMQRYYATQTTVKSLEWMLRRYTPTQSVLSKTSASVLAPVIVLTILC